MNAPHQSGKKTVGLFGCYWIQNYGDDLMGLMFAKALNDAGYDVLAYGMQGYEGAFGIRTTFDSDEFIEQSDAMVLGGGGFMVPRKISAASDYQVRMDRVSEQIGREAKSRGIPLHAISIGGKGQGTTPGDLPNGWRAMLSSMDSITVRNAGDVPLAKQFCDDVAHYADIVWRVPDLARPEPKHTLPGSTVLINHPVISLGASPQTILRWCRREIPWIKRKAMLRIANPKLRFHTFPAHMSYHGQPTMMDNMNLMLDLLRQSPVVISNALHVGVTALAFGNAMLSYHGPGKTKVLMEELDIDGYCGTSTAMVNAGLKDIQQTRKNASIAPNKLAEIQQDAGQHLAHLLDRVEASLGAPVA